MAKEIVKDETNKSAPVVFESDSFIYDGERGNILTVYKKGTPISEVKPQHRKLFGL